MAWWVWLLLGAVSGAALMSAVVYLVWCIGCVLEIMDRGMGE